MRTIEKRILSALLDVLAVMALFTACGEDKKVDYEKLKTDIVGIWCDINGPEYFENDGDPYYQLYEFTSDGRLAYHSVFPYISQYVDIQYTLRDDFLDVDGAMCKVSVENDVLTMKNDNGTSQFRRMTVEEVCNFSVVYLDQDNYYAQIDYTDAFTKNWPLAAATESAASETAASESVSETEADGSVSETAESIAS